MRRRPKTHFGVPVSWPRRQRFFGWMAGRTLAQLVYERDNFCAGSDWKFMILMREINGRTNHEALALLDVTGD